MKSAVAALLVLVSLVPACSKPTPTPAVIAPLRNALVVDAPAPPIMFDIAGARPTISASHAGDIVELAVTSSGSAALTLDVNGGVRLWPSLRGDLAPVVVQFNEATQLALGERADYLVAAAIDVSGGLQLHVLSKAGGSVSTQAIRGDAEFIEVVFVTGHGLLALSADQQLHRIDDTGRVTQTFTMPPGIRAVTLCHAAGVVVALAQMSGKPVALTLGGTNAAPVWSVPLELPGTAILTAANLDAGGQRLAVAIGAGAAAPLPPVAAVVPAADEIKLKPKSADKTSLPAPPPTVIVGPKNDQVAIYDVTSRASLARLDVPTNAFTVNTQFRSIVAFITKDRVYYRGTVSGKLDVPGVSAKPDAAAVDPWVVASPPETENNDAPSAAATASPGVLIVAHGKHLRIEASGTTKFLGYRYPQLSPFDTQGKALLAWSATRRTLLTLDATGHVSSSKLTDLSNMVVYDDRHRIGLVRSEKRDAPTLRIAAIFDDEPMITLPSFSSDAYSVQYGQRSSLLALHNNNGDVVMAVYDRSNNSISKPFTIKGYATVFLLDPTLTNGLVAYSVKSTSSSVEMAVTAFRIEAGALKVDSTFRVMGSIFTVDPAGQILVASTKAQPNQMRGFEIYNKNVKVRDLVLPGVPQLSPDGRRLAVLEGARLSVYDAAGQRLWLQAAAAGALVWAADGQQLFVAADGGVMTFDATTGSASSRCGWNFGLSDDIPEDAGRTVTRSICERGL